LYFTSPLDIFVVPNMQEETSLKAVDMEKVVFLDRVSSKKKVLVTNQLII